MPDNDYSESKATPPPPPLRQPPLQIIPRSGSLEDGSDGGGEKVGKGMNAKGKELRVLDSAVSDALKYADPLAPGPDVPPEGLFSEKIPPWRKGERLGSGSAGAVYKAITDDGFSFAVKEVSLLDQGSLSQLEQEISVLSQLKHENIVQYLGTQKDNEKLYIFLELMPRDSLSSFYNKHSLTELQVATYTRQILEALKYLHNKTVIHRDVKCSNILISASGSVKLADFGLAKVIKTNDANSFKGTIFWMAPEVANCYKDGSYGLAADIWSLGCTVLEMFTRKTPYFKLGPWQGQAVKKVYAGVPPEVPEYLPSDARDFISECLRADPKDRPSAVQLLAHRFVTNRCTARFASPLGKIKLS